MSIDYPSEPDEGRVPAPPLTPAEQASVERFESAADPYRLPCCGYPDGAGHRDDCDGEVDA